MTTVSYNNNNIDDLYVTLLFFYDVARPSECEALIAYPVSFTCEFIFK